MKKTILTIDETSFKIVIGKGPASRTCTKCELKKECHDYSYCIACFLSGSDQAYLKKVKTLTKCTKK